MPSGSRTVGGSTGHAVGCRSRCGGHGLEVRPRRGQLGAWYAELDLPSRSESLIASNWRRRVGGHVAPAPRAAVLRWPRAGVPSIDRQRAPTADRRSPRSRPAARSRRACAPASSRRRRRGWSCRMPCVTRCRRICSRKRSGMFPSAARWLHGTGIADCDCANCKVAWTAYATVRDNFISSRPRSGGLRLLRNRRTAVRPLHEPRVPARRNQTMQ